MRKSCPLVALGTDKPMLDFAQVIFFLTSTAMLLGPILHLGKALQVPTTRASYNQSYTYDLQGNLSKRGNQVFTFDQGNRLKSVPGIASYQSPATNMMAWAVASRSAMLTVAAGFKSIAQPDNCCTPRKAVRLARPPPNTCICTMA